VIRFHLDEQVDHDIAQGLRLRGIDVTTASDAGLLGASDEAHIAFALEQRRLILTHDADYLRSASAGCSHAGILLLRRRFQIGWRIGPLSVPNARLYDR
jgi:predicted nuclease of predicted toxin-antitoxin system